MTVAVIVMEWEGSVADVEAGLKGLRIPSSMNEDGSPRYDTPEFSYAAEDLDSLPHPSQVTEIREHFENSSKQTTSK